MAAKKEQPPVFDFLMSVDCALGHGPIHSLNAVYFREKLGWLGPATVDGATYIDKHKLFGGDDAGEGGVSGTMEIYLGGWKQKMSGALARRFKRTPDTAPGYRGIAHAFFHGSRPPGVDAEFGIAASPIWGTSATALEPGTDYEEIDFETTESWGDLNLLRAQIDSGQANVLFSWSATRPIESILAWYAGTRIEFIDAAGQITPATKNAVSGENVTQGVRTRTISHFLQIPPGTRRMRYVVVSTRTPTVETNENIIFLSSGQLTNFFGDNFEYSELDTGGNSGFRWSTSTPWYQSPEFSITVAPASLDQYPNVEPFIWPIIGPNESGGGYLQGSWDTAFKRDSILAKDHQFNKVGEFARDLTLGPSYERQELYTNEEIKLDHLPDANPACIVYECMINSDWGRGESAARLDIRSYAEAAVTLQDEKFGLSLRWNGQEKIEDFISTILDHISAAHFVHPVTGLWTLRLLRDDYDPNECIVLDESNCSVTSCNVLGYGEIINQVKVEYTNPLSEETETVEANNAANIAVQGGVVSDTRSYIGIRNRWLAQIVANRDVQQAGAALATVEFQVPRHLGSIAPAQVVRLNWPKFKIGGFFRINERDPGSSGAKIVKYKATMDVFSAPEVEVQVDPDGALENEQEQPPEAPDQMAVMSAPYFGTLAGDEPLTSPFNRLVATGGDSERRYSRITMFAETTNGAGNTGLRVVRTILPGEIVTLGVDLTPEAVSKIPALSLEGAGGLALNSGALFVIGTTDAEHEIVMLDAYNSSDDTWSVVRGCFDTVPVSWETTAPLLSGNFLRGPAVVGTFAAGEEVEFFVTSTNLHSELSLADASLIEHTVRDRYGAPTRPANVSIDGNGFGDTEYGFGELPAVIPITWANRNRTMEDGVVPRWTDGNVAPEAGQTTTLRFWGGNDFDVLDFEATGITGTSYDLDPVNLASFQRYEVEFVAVRDGVDSYQSARRLLTVPRSGYGFNYGNDYSENDG